MVKTLGQVAEYWLADPQRAVELQTRLGKRLSRSVGAAAKRLAGEQAAAGRRARPEGQALRRPGMASNQFFDFLKQAYLLTARWADKLVSDADGLDPHTRQKAEFYVGRSPTRCRRRISCSPIRNCCARRSLSNADNLVRGMHMLAEDIEAGDGDLRSASRTPRCSRSAATWR